MAEGRGIGNWFAPWRFLLFIALLLIGVPACHQLLHRWALGGMATFDVAATIFLLLCLPLLTTRQASTIREHAVQNDANRKILLGVTGAVIGVLLIAIAAETIGHNPQPLTKGLIIFTLALAWLFSNVIYALHYAHAYYTLSDETEEDVGGIEFPGTKMPSYGDFLYFALTLGMTFQTSDVNITAPGIRHVALMHSFAAFIFSIGLIAFTINVLGGAG